MTNDLISREALKEAFKIEELYWGKRIIDIIDNAPTVCERYRSFCMAKPERPQGEWITKNTKEPCGTDENHETIYRLVPRPHCNKCNIPQIRKTHFCPNCGADMRGKEE